MTPQRRQRMILASMIIFGVTIAVGLVLIAVKENVMLFYTPSQVVSGEAEKHKTFRIGGMVKTGSVQRQANGITVEFDLLDDTADVTVRFTGILPDLFREGQGIVSLGALNENGVFVAEEVLAKHDENYMPPEIADAMKKKMMAKEMMAKKEL